MYSEVYQKISKAAWEANVSPTRLCQEAGVDESTLWRWKTNRNSPTQATLEKIFAKAEELKKLNPHLKSE